VRFAQESAEAMAVPWPTCRHPAMKFRLPRPEASGRGRGDFAFANKKPLWSGRLGSGGMRCGGLPVARQQLSKPELRDIGDASEHIGAPGQRISFAVMISVVIAAARWEPANSQDLRPGQIRVARVRPPCW
jgi:hypothetical protein